MRCSPRFLAVGCFLSFGTPMLAAAQSVTVRVVEDGYPVQGVLLTLIDTAGVSVARSLSDADGSALLRSSPGRFRVRAELIGRAATETDLFSIVADAVVRRTITLSPNPVQLDAIAVDATSRCDVRPATGRPASVVWNEARKALESEQVGRLSGFYRFDIEHFVRELDPAARRVTSDERRVVRNLTTNPFRSRPAAELAELGYLRETTTGDILYAPTPDVLLSDEFLDTHCFHVVRGDGDDTEIGLAFEPVSGRDLPDVSGVLWLDATTAALRRLVFHYQNLPDRLPDGPYGGDANLRELPSGVWIVRDWRIRTPVIGAAESRVGRTRIVDQAQLLAIHEEGAEILRIEERGGTLIADARRATLVGSIHHGSDSRPLPGATITLQGTSFEATTDVRGRFHIAGLPQGEYTVAWTHERLTGSGFQAAPVHVALHDGETAEVSFRLPAGAELQPTAAELARADSVAAAARALGASRHALRAVVDTTSPADPVRILGRVLDENGRALETVAVEITDPAMFATSSGSGRFTLREVPPGRRVLRASRIGYVTREDTVEIEAGTVVDVEIRLATEPVELPPISVEARSRWLAIQGFYDRRDDGLSGHVITRADIERQKPTRLEDLLDDVSGVRIYSIGVGKTSVRFSRYVSLANGNPLDGCEPLIWLDGQRYIEKLSIRPTHGDISHVEDINFISPEIIEAIEIYVGNPPIRFNHACGVILIWTRRGG